MDKHQVIKQYNSLIVLTEKGCPACNSALAQTIVLNKFENTLILVSAVGTTIDLTDIRLNSLNNNIVYDYQTDFREFNLKGSGVLMLTPDYKVDSVVDISAQKLNSQLKFVKGLANTKF